ncbi:hypothetical protein DVH24_009473 [Malus domestica]|uniref:Uncharacterized protein n=1 Tax=Malus domestica TaxID=3750 RepID=A0A498IUU4_MALDO|nr:hypothetical protein DVH24_009473 [Malus domestica]
MLPPHPLTQTPSSLSPSLSASAEKRPYHPRRRRAPPPLATPCDERHTTYYRRRPELGLPRSFFSLSQQWRRHCSRIFPGEFSQFPAKESTLGEIAQFPARKPTAFEPFFGQLRPRTRKPKVYFGSLFFELRFDIL